MNIGVIGTGYVGLVQGVVLAEFGMNVVCMDVDSKKIEMLKKKEIPIYEPGLEEILKKNIEEERIQFTSNLKKAIESCEVIFIAVGTPAEKEGSADLSSVLGVAGDIGEYINSYKVIVMKSTVPIGTAGFVKEIIKEKIRSKGLHYKFDVVSNPEFLREGKAVQDCLTPDRVIIGTESEKARNIMKNVYDVLYINKTPFIFTDNITAELIKYASNAFLATKISFINEIALLADKCKANVQEISQAMGMDGRISPKFLHAGPGYGGSCFPKDTKALLKMAEKFDEKLFVVEAAVKANEKQKEKMIEKIRFSMMKDGNLKGKKIAILGLSFKPETDDMREAPSIDIIKGLISSGAKIQAYCPKGIKEAKWRLLKFEKEIIYTSNEYEAAKNTDALVIITEWNQFRGLDFERLLKVMKDNYFFDLRNIYSLRNDQIKKFKYSCLGTIILYVMRERVS